MRWLYCSERNPDEWALRKATEAKIEAWWKEFASHARDLEALFKRQSEWDLPAWMQEHLQGIDPGLMWEFGPGVRANGHRLVVTPEHESRLRPMVDTLIGRAPTLPGWEFYAYRLPEDVATALAGVTARCGSDLGPAQAAVAKGAHGLIDLTFESPHVRSDDDRDALAKAFVLAESILGEEVLDTWVGLVEVRRARRGGLLGLLGGSRTKPATLSLDAVQPAVVRAIAEVRDALPRSPCNEWCLHASWSLLELKPQRAPDYPRQDDLLVGKTPNLELWKATRNPNFHGQRFSSCGEVFCYVKIDGTQGLDKEKFADKGAIEDALDDVLIPAGLGCQIGGGTGLMYSYIELALTDVARGVDAVCARLRAGNIPRRTWILFHDANLVGEWVGVYDETPPPPVSVD